MIKFLFSVGCMFALSVAASANVATTNVGVDSLRNASVGIDSLHGTISSRLGSLDKNDSFTDGKAQLQLASRYHSPRHRRNHSGRYYSRRSHRGSGLGYFVGGLIIGNILTEAHRHQTHSHSRYDDYQSSRYDDRPNQSAPVYWLDKRGDCFRLESRSHGEVYVQVADQECY